MIKALNTLINNVNEMKVNLDGLPLEYRSRMINENMNNDLNYIVNKLTEIKYKLMND